MKFELELDDCWIQALDQYSIQVTRSEMIRDFILLAIDNCEIIISDKCKHNDDYEHIINVKEMI